MMARKLSVARLKALSHAVWMLDLLQEPHRHRIAALRPDQVALLEEHDQQLLDVVLEQSQGKGSSPQ